MGHTVGVLLDRKIFMGISKGKTGNEKLSLYNQVAKQHNLTPFYTSLHQIGITTAQGYIYTKNKYKFVRRPIPKVTHNRAMTLSPFLKRKLKQLSKNSFIFNRQNRYDKYYIYKLLHQNIHLRDYLPVSLKYSEKVLKSAMAAYQSLFIKPTNDSIGNGIMKLTKQLSGKWLLFWKKGKQTLLSAKRAVSVIQKVVGKRTYMIQETIALATYKGRPYDLRVSVQRGTSGRWQVTGVVGKVASAGRHVTNVAKGGKVRRTEVLFKNNRFNFETMMNDIRRASISIMNDLSGKLPHLADVGLDIGIDHRGHIKLIEVNGRDQRYSFKKAKMSATFYRTYETPLQYAKYLLQQAQSSKS
ncbi:YheC/YheD family protein [Paenibacillus sp. HWE-109]|uniref:YheC/YheD family protein n=1 Tax=Paenibacillus sp. HWE-109 TaxID=1306526 RepID=UPI001EDD0EDC|nr:YheC/YheD family protein [Paenibacillus sp. HWE-109]UKS23911.1 YheC/YheD family protein [Paenibacillus sp. HWE-109]